LNEVYISARAEQGWIDKLRMLRRVNSIWNSVAWSIYPDLTEYIPEDQQSPEQKEFWRSAFHRERQRAQDRICGLRDPTGPSDKPWVRCILDISQPYPATLDIQVEAKSRCSLKPVKTLVWIRNQNDQIWVRIHPTL